MRFCTEKYHMATFPNSFTLGSAPLPVEKSLNEAAGVLDFHGCILKLRIGKHDLKVTHPVSRSNTKVIHDVPTQNDSSTETENNSNNSVCFPGKSDYRLQILQRIVTGQDASRTDVPEKVELQIVFRTVDKTLPLMAWEGASGARENRMRIDVFDGRMEVSLVCDGRKNITIRNTIQVDDNEKHNFTLRRSRNKLEVYLDSTAETLLPHKSCSSLLGGGDVFILGQNVSKKNQSEDYLRTFRGCIQELLLTNHSVDLRKALPQKLMCNPS